MRATVGQREKLAFDVEDDDLAPLDVDELAASGGKIAH
jgi:hypothetical protein